MASIRPLQASDLEAWVRLRNAPNAPASLVALHETESSDRAAWRLQLAPVEGEIVLLYDQQRFEAVHAPNLPGRDPATGRRPTRWCRPGPRRHRLHAGERHGELPER